MSELESGAKPQAKPSRDEQKEAYLSQLDERHAGQWSAEVALERTRGEYDPFREYSVMGAPLTEAKIEQIHTGSVGRFTNLIEQGELKLRQYADAPDHLKHVFCPHGPQEVIQNQLRYFLRLEQEEVAYRRALTDLEARRAAPRVVGPWNGEKPADLGSI
jgi:hypothetical protein